MKPGMKAPPGTPDRYSLWDTIACLGVKPTLRRLWAGTPRGVRLERARVRTLRFAELARAPADGVQPGSDRWVELVRLGEDYRRRAARWEGYFEPEQEESGSKDDWWDGWSGFFNGAMSIVDFGEVAWVLPVLGVVLAAAAVSLVPLLLIPPLVFSIRRGRARGRLRLALSGRRCADCGYDLRGLDPALPAKLLDGTDVGPVACPECGSPWPLVPPPVRGERR
jgi:hypothetical protein